MELNSSNTMTPLKSVGYCFVHVQSYSQESSESPCFAISHLHRSTEMKKSLYFLLAAAPHIRNEQLPLEFLERGESDMDQ